MIKLISLLSLLERKGIITQEDIYRLRSADELLSHLRVEGFITANEIKSSQIETAKLSLAILKAFKNREGGSSCRRILKEEIGGLLTEDRLQVLSELIIGFKKTRDI